MTDPPLDALVRAAKDGDAGALEQLVVTLQREVYPLALRMTGHEADAEDAAQEILLKVVTRLASFRGEASVRTWTYRIAMNHLRDRARSRVEALELDFDRFGADLLDGLEAPSPDVDPVLAVAVKRACTAAMLTCLDRDARAAYLVGEVFGLSAAEASDVLGVGAAAYRQRLSRARRRLRAFTAEHCGLVSPAAACRCGRRAARALALGRIRPPQQPVDPDALERAVAEMEAAHDTASLMRWQPSTPAPAGVLETLRRLLRNGWPPTLMAE